MAAVTIKGAAEELAAALAALAEPILDAEAVLLGISKMKFRRDTERELAVAMSNSAVSLRRAARANKSHADNILRGVRELEAKALALAGQQGGD
jgi:hypothetical protein